MKHHFLSHFRKYRPNAVRIMVGWIVCSPLHISALSPCEHRTPPEKHTPADVFYLAVQRKSGQCGDRVRKWVSSPRVRAHTHVDPSGPSALPIEPPAHSRVPVSSVHADLHPSPPTPQGDSPPNHDAPVSADPPEATAHQPHAFHWSLPSPPSSLFAPALTGTTAYRPPSGPFHHWSNWSNIAPGYRPLPSTPCTALPGRHPQPFAMPMTRGL